MQAPRRAPQQPDETGRWLRRAALVGLVGYGVRSRWTVRERDSRIVDLGRRLDAERRASQELTGQLRAEARTDPLTGLGNRRRWQEQLAHELDRAGRAGTTIAVALVDLDRFKLVNDGRGHDVGDALLRQVAAAFADSVRSVDLLARLGGDEFAVALPEVGLPDALRIVERLRASTPFPSTASCGLALWDGREDAAALLRRADNALYRAKAAGRDRLVVAVDPPADAGS